MIRLTLPIPPSVNELYLNNAGRGRHRRVAPVYTDWRWRALIALKAQIVEPIESGKWRMTLRLPRAMRGDCSNRIKAVEDFLVANKITPDDRHNDHPEAFRDDAVPAGQCVVEVSSLDPSAAVVGARGPEASASGPSSFTEGTGVRL